MKVTSSEYAFKKFAKINSRFKKFYTIIISGSGHTVFDINAINNRMSLQTRRGTDFHPRSDLILLLTRWESDESYYVSKIDGGVDKLRQLLNENGHDLYLPSSTAG